MNKKILLEMVKSLDSIANQEKVCYVLSYGSLIGAVREKGFIPWDDEIDIWVKQDVYESFMKKLKKYLPSKFEVLDREDLDYELFYARVTLKGFDHHKLHIDIFPLIGCPETNSSIAFFVLISYISNKIFYIKRLNSRKLYYNNKMFKRYIREVNTLSDKKLSYIS